MFSTESSGSLQLSPALQRRLPSSSGLLLLAAEAPANRNAEAFDDNEGQSMAAALRIQSAALDHRRPSATICAGRRSPSLFELRIGPTTADSATSPLQLLAPMSVSSFGLHQHQHQLQEQQHQQQNQQHFLLDHQQPSSSSIPRACSPSSPLLLLLGTASRRSSSRRSYSGRPLTNRCNKSCDWLGPPGSRLAVGIGGGAQTPVEDNFRSNPIAQVSSDILRAQGYTQQFKSLLSSGTRARRDSVPGSTSEAVAAAAAKARGAISQQQSLEERCNGDLLSSLTPGGGSGLAIGGGPQTAVPTPATKSLEWNLGVEDGCGGSPSRKDQQHQILRRRQSGYGISITTESQAKMRCKLRKLYFLKRNKICDLSLALAVIGLAFVVLEQELTALEIVSKRSAPSLMLRSACVASTLMLIASLINYHRTEVKIALIDSGAEDWRVALTTDRVIKLMIEICVCAVCPFPGSGTIAWPYISADERRMTLVSVPLDVLLSVPMFLRAYLLCRFMVLHSRQFQDAATRSIAALNRISMDFRFVIKTMMADHPMTVLVVFTCCYWICMSWMFTQCERYNGRYAGTEYYYMNSLWFIMVTFMSIGYGDVVPTSYCGRFLSITTGIVGAGVSSALIAVISRKLELSRAEKHVNNFMADSKLTNARKNAAASVLQHTWFIHRYQQRNGHKGDDLRLRQHQRKFLNAINDFRRIKWDQRKLQEKGNSLLDVGKLHTEMHETLWEMHRTQDHFASMIEVLTQRIAELQQTVLAATQLQPMAAAAAATGGLPNIPIQQQLLTPMSAANTNTSSTTTTTTNPPSLSSPIPNYYNSNCTNNNSGVGGGGRMAPTRKTSMSAQLRVPNNGDYVTPPTHPPIRKYSAVHPPPHYHQNPAPAPHHPTTAVPYQCQQQQHPLGHAHSQQNNNNSSSRISINACANAVQMPVILDGFGPSSADELAAPMLTNSRSSPCLQKSQQQQNHQQQQTLGRTMRVLQQQAEQEEDECRPLMGCADEMA